jgi:hypothetical protein
MNDIEAFEKYLDESVMPAHEIKLFETMNERQRIRFGMEKAWQAAIEYKQKEIDELDEISEYLADGYNHVKAQNKKLREALEWYANRKNCDNPDFAHVEIDEHGEEIADGGYKAREALK